LSVCREEKRGFVHSRKSKHSMEKKRVLETELYDSILP
jgi:hypothetical protein